MLLFIALQYNDPDGLMWAVVYAVPALVMLRVILRPDCFSTRSGKALRWAAVALMLVGTILFLPKDLEFLQYEVWWDNEQMREALGVMVALLVTLSSFLAKSKK